MAVLHPCPCARMLSPLPRAEATGASFHQVSWHSRSLAAFPVIPAGRPPH